MKFNVREGVTFPSCYSTPQAFLDSLANAMSFQDTTTTPLFYNGDLRQATTGFGPPKISDATAGDIYYGDAVWYDPRKGGALYTDSNFTSSLREIMPNKGYRRFWGRAYGDIVPFLWVSAGSPNHAPISTANAYYFPNDVACAYNDWQRKVPYTVSSTNTIYNVVERPWVYCDGFNYSTHPVQVQQSSKIGRVPNLISRMIIGKGPASANATVSDERLPENLKGGLGTFGGSMSTKLGMMDQIPDHRHNFVDKASGSSVSTSSSAKGTGYAITDPIEYQRYSTLTESAMSGSDLAWPSPNNVKAHQNLPPYYVVGFKMYVGYGD